MSAFTMFAKPKRIKAEGGELEIVYEVQWKTSGCDDDKAEIIGILDTQDNNLDWKSFKSYLIQNSGNMRLSTDDIKISYIDSDDDIIPVDSETEFRECLKFSRTRARHGRKVILKVSMAGNGAKPKEIVKTEGTKVSKPKHLFPLKKRDLLTEMAQNKKKAVSFEQAVSSDVSTESAVPPAWFEFYMQKFKAELIQEVTEAVVTNIKSSGAAGVNTTHSHSRRSPLSEPRPYASVHIIEKRKKKKKMSEEDSSDCTDGLQLQWEEKLELLRHMQKISKREKKFEKKLDAKLEKLETKTKKIMEKKCLLNDGQLARVDMKRRVRMLNAAAGPASAGAQGTEQIMDALPIDEYSYEPHVMPGEVVTQTWKVINSGNTPWSDDTELRFAWGSKSLVPLTTAVKCPSLQPGEAGSVKVQLQAPTFPGKFESYWHFHHGGRRFGHWLGCAVVVDPDEDYLITARGPVAGAHASHDLPQLSAVDLTVEKKCKRYTASTTDDMKIFNEQNEKEKETEMVKVVQHPDNSLSMGEATNAWSTYAPSAPSVPVADLLNIKESPEANEVREHSSPDKEKVDNITQAVSSMTIYGVPEQWKNDEIPADLNKEEIQNAEYVSASDSDNISVISGTVSIDSEETEPSEEFVVIPMPQCFSCEQEVAVTQPISVEIPKTPEEVVQESDNNNNMELKPYPELPMFLPVLVTEAQESGYSEGEAELPTEPTNEPVVDDQDPNNVYIRDATGKSVPVAKVLLKKSESPQPPKGFAANVGISHNTFGDPNVGHGPNGPRFPFGFETAGVPPQCHNPGGSTNFRPQRDCTKNPPTNRTKSENFCGHPCPDTNPFKKSESCHCPPQAQFLRQEVQAGLRGQQQAQSRQCKRQSWSHCFQNIHTEQPRSCRYSYVFEKEPKKSSTASNSSSRRSTSSNESREASPVAAAVQILPETLVTGAVNVASSAINTARTVIDMLIPRHDDVVTGHWEQLPQAVEDSLRTLSEMGFNNRELNIMLLKKHNNDVTRVISELVQ